MDRINVFNLPIDNNIDQIDIKQLDLENLVDENWNYGQIVEFIHFDEANELIITDEAFDLLQRYSPNEIAFISVYGQKTVGKSFLLDTVLNLSGFQGSHFEKYSGKTDSLRIWTIPYTRDNIKIFLLDCSGFNGEQLTRNQQKILDILMLLSSTVMILGGVQDLKGKIMESINLIFCQSMQRLINNNGSTNKHDEYWPRSICCIYRNHQRAHKDISALSQIFQVFNFTVLIDAQYKESKTGTLTHQNASSNYIKKAALIFRNLYEGVQTKKYLNLKNTGNVIAKLLISETKQVNKKPKINMEKIYKETLSDLYNTAYQFHTKLYDEQLHQYFIEEKPYSMEYVLDSFKECKQQIFNSFAQMDINYQMEREYEDKLEKYISNSEQLILEINRKKTLYFLKNEPIQLPDSLSEEDVNKFIFTLHDHNKECNHDRSIFVGHKLMAFVNSIDEGEYQQQSMINSQVSDHLHQAVQQKMKELGDLKDRKLRVEMKNNSYEQQAKKMRVQLQSLGKKISSTAKQIQIEKKRQKKYNSVRQASQQQQQKLLAYRRQLDQNFRENENVIKQISKSYEFNPSVAILQKRLQEKKTECQRLLDVIDRSKIKYSRKTQLRQIKSGSFMTLSNIK